MYCPLKARTRETPSIGTTIEGVYVDNFPPYAVKRTYADYRPGSHKVITDEILDWDLVKHLPAKKRCSLENQLKIFKEVSSSKSEYFLSEPSALRSFYFNHATYPGGRSKQFDSAYVFAEYRPDFAVTDMKGFDQRMLIDAMKDIQPHIEDYDVTGINLFTMILELADIRKTFSKSVLKFKADVDTLADKNLTISFGILPLIGDIQAIYSLLMNLNDSINKWNAAASSNVVWDKHGSIHRNEISNETRVKSPSTVLPAAFDDVFNLEGEGETSALLHLYFAPSHIGQDLRSQIRNSLLGLDKPISGVWEAVPFSWFIDYFVNIGEMIESYEDSLVTRLPYQFVGMGYSVKEHFAGNFKWSLAPNFDNLGGYHAMTADGPWVGEVYTETYVRRRVSYKVMFDYLSMPDELTLRHKAGARQYSYIASIAWLWGKK